MLSNWVIMGAKNRTSGLSTVMSTNDRLFSYRRTEMWIQFVGRNETTDRSMRRSHNIFMSLLISQRPGDKTRNRSSHRLVSIQFNALLILSIVDHLTTDRSHECSVKNGWREQSSWSDPSAEVNGRTRISKSSDTTALVVLFWAKFSGFSLSSRGDKNYQ